MATPIKVQGLAQLRRSLRTMDKEALKEVQSVTKRAAEIVAAESRTLAPHRSGRLAASIKAATAGNNGVVRSKLPYSKVHEYGGTISPKGTPITIKRSLYVHRAFEAKQDAVGRELAKGFDELAVRQGWK